MSNKENAPKQDKMKTLTRKTILIGFGIIIGLFITLLSINETTNSKTTQLKNETEKSKKLNETYTYSFHLFQW